MHALRWSLSLLSLVFACWIGIDMACKDHTLKLIVQRLQEWMTPQPSRRPDVQPEFEKLEVPLPRKLPGALPSCTFCHSALKVHLPMSPCYSHQYWYPSPGSLPRLGTKCGK